MPAFGVYPVADALTAGDEISSTYEGRHVTLLESELIHNAHGDGFVDKGDPVVFGTVALQGVGVALKSATAATDLIAIDTEGIWVLDCYAADDGGASAIEGGDRLYIANSTPCAISKIATAATQVPFGYALGHVDAGATETIAVKVHWDPIDNAVLDGEPFYFGDSRDCKLEWETAIIGAADTLLLTNDAVGAMGSAFQIKATAIAGTQDVGIAAYFDATAVGVMTGNWVYGFGAWLNLDTTFDAPAGHYEIVAQSNGVYAAAVVDYATADVVYGLKAEGILTAQPEDLYAISLNSSAQGSVNTAIFYSANAETVGWVGGHLSGVAAGHLALAVVNGSGVATEMFVNLWSA